jgi:hypothetical protein
MLGSAGPIGRVWWRMTAIAFISIRLGVETFIRTKYTQYGSNNWIIQDLDSEMCGWYCLCFAWYYIKENQEPRESLLSVCNYYINQLSEIYFIIYRRKEDAPREWR